MAATRDAFRSGRSLEIPFRKQQLKKVQELMEENKTRIFDALKHDLSKVRMARCVCGQVCVHGKGGGALLQGSNVQPAIWLGTLCHVMVHVVQ